MQPETANASVASSYSKEDIASALAIVQSDSNFRVLRAFTRDGLEVFKEPDDQERFLGMFIDVETTGKEVELHKPVEIAYVIAEVSARGDVYRIVDTYEGLEDPGFPMDPEVIAIHGITDAMVAGKTFDRERIRADLAKVDLVVSHNANFDRPMLERKDCVPEFKDKSWGCSLLNGPWKEMAMSIKKLEWLALKVCGMFYPPHRALIDAQVMLEVVRQGAHNGQPILGHIIERSQQLTYTVWATDSPFERKDDLKKAEYRWSDGTEPGKLKAWHKTGVTDLEAELAYLSENIYSRSANATVDSIDPLDAFTSRYTERAKMPVGPKPRVGMRAP